MRIGFVGVGLMGQCAHLQNYVTLDACEVMALAEVRTALCEKVAARYGIPHVYDGHEKLLANEDLDGIVASQPYQRHGRLLPDLYAAGVPIFTEKPLARSVEAGKDLIAALERNNATHFVGYHKRSDPAILHAMKQIGTYKRTGMLGALRYIRLTMPPAKDWSAGGFNQLITSAEAVPQLPVDPPPADLDAKSASEFDAFINYYIHQINLMRHLMGEDYSVAYADPHRKVIAVHGGNDVTGVIEMAPYRTTMSWQEQALVCFDSGFIKIDLPSPLAQNRAGTVSIFEDCGHEENTRTMTPELPPIHAMRQQAIHFIEAIEGKATPLCTAQEAMQDLEVARTCFALMNRS